MSEDTQKFIGFVAAVVLIGAIVIGGAMGDYYMKKRIIKDALQEIEAERGHK
jgi:hypothetical protein